MAAILNWKVEMESLNKNNHLNQFLTLELYQINNIGIYPK